MSGWERAVYRVLPPAQLAMRAGIYWAREMFVLQFRRPRLGRLVERMALRHLNSQVEDPALRERLRPRYAMGCKRILPTDDWYPALVEPNVEVVTDGIREVRANSIVAEDGVEREVDTIIFGTGFHVTDIPIAGRIRGRDGRTLSETWAGSPSAYKGSAVAGYPNLFFLVGPNTGLGHNSIVFMIEAQIRYLTGALRALRRDGVATIEVRSDAQAAYNAEIDRMTEGTVWVSGGCKSWYIDANGHNSTLWPTFTWPFRRRLREFDEPAYALGGGGARARAGRGGVARQRVLVPRQALVLEYQDGARQVGVAQVAVRDEGSLVEPGPGVPQARAGQCGPFGQVVARQWARPVRVPEDDMLRARGEHVRHAAHGEQPGPSQLDPGQLRMEGAEPEPVQDLDGARDRDLAEQHASRPGPRRSRASRPCVRACRRGSAPPGPRPPRAARRTRISARARPRSRPRKRNRGRGR